MVATNTPADPKRPLRQKCLALGLFLAGVVFGVGIARPPDSWRGQRKTAAATNAPVTITLSAIIDGSDRFIFTPDVAYDEHARWGIPKNVVFNRQPWVDLSQPPPGWTELVPGLDLNKASILTRKGRDVIALEPTPAGFDIYFADTQMGAGPYEVTISVPRITDKAKTHSR